MSRYKCPRCGEEMTILETPDKSSQAHKDAIRKAVEEAYNNCFELAQSQARHFRGTYPATGKRDAIFGCESVAAKIMLQIDAIRNKGCVSQKADEEVVNTICDECLGDGERETLDGKEVHACPRCGGTGRVRR